MMADKNVDKLKDLFDEKTACTHGRTWGKVAGARIIGSGGIHDKKADIHEV